eukprot:TRINITY_DN14031_c0_g1_i1.p1 TRINITY_DN14031_c0_g1~~TRINITY_DN14031_c0_g1_i1.p1  ORF type:complete len:427 (-),score=95.67 TRINITY_DN14031_c0_g1_i1:161-1441(-)
MGARRPITRNLTGAFIQHRREHKSRLAESGGYDPLPGVDGDLERGRHGASSASFHRAELPPQWVDSSVEAQEDITAVSDKLAQLVKAQQRRLMKVMADSSADTEVEAISSELNALIRRCEQSIHQVKTRGSGAETTAAELEFRTNIQRSLASQLSQLSKQCREKQKEYLAELRRRHGPGYDDNLGASEASPSRTGGEGTPLLQQQDLDLDRREAFAAQRSNDICKIADSVQELNTMFRELAVMVIDQGTILDRIDYNTEQMVLKARKGNAALQKTEKAKKQSDERSFKCMGLLAILNIILLLVLMVKYKLKYGISVVGMFWFVIFTGAAAGAGYAVVRYRPQWCHKAFPTLASWTLPSDTNPNAPTQNRFQRWASNAKSAVGIPQAPPVVSGMGARKQMQVAAAGMAAAKGVGNAMQSAQAFVGGR